MYSSDHNWQLFVRFCLERSTLAHSISHEPGKYCRVSRARIAKGASNRRPLEVSHEGALRQRGNIPIAALASAHLDVASKSCGL